MARPLGGGALDLWVAHTPSPTDCEEGSALTVVEGSVLIPDGPPSSNDSVAFSAERLSGEAAAPHPPATGPLAATAPAAATGGGANKGAGEPEAL